MNRYTFALVAAAFVAGGLVTGLLIVSLYPPQIADQESDSPIRVSRDSGSSAGSATSQPVRANLDGLLRNGVVSDQGVVLKDTEYQQQVARLREMFVGDPYAQMHLTVLESGASTPSCFNAVEDFSVLDQGIVDAAKVKRETLLAEMQIRLRVANGILSQSHDNDKSLHERSMRELRTIIMELYPSVFGNTFDVEADSLWDQKVRNTYYQACVSFASYSTPEDRDRISIGGDYFDSLRNDNPDHAAKFVGIDPFYSRRHYLVVDWLNMQLQERGSITDEDRQHIKETVAFLNRRFDYIDEGSHRIYDFSGDSE
ncbi:MAG: hypothetical protein R3C01_01375 [Planctomycetaceae bacterium]